MKSDIVERIISYFTARPEAVAVYLFGSYARDREKESSDIDLAVLLDHEAFSDQHDLRTTYLVDLARLTRKDLHVVIMNKAGEGILAQIFKYGKSIYQKDPKILSRFKMISYSLIADFGYQRRLMEKGFAEGILRETA